MQIDSPQVVIPSISSDNGDRLVADLGDFVMHNEFSQVQSRETMEYSQREVFVCEVSKVHMKSVRGGNETLILKDVKLGLLLMSSEHGKTVCIIILLAIQIFTIT